MIFAGVFILLGLGSLAINPVVGALVLLLAVGRGLSSFAADIEITNAGGQSIGHRMAYYERAAAREFTQALNTVPARDLVDLAWFIRHFTFRSEALRSRASRPSSAGPHIRGRLLEALERIQAG